MKTAEKKGFLGEAEPLACIILILTDGIKGMERGDIVKYYARLQMIFPTVLPEVNNLNNPHLLRTALQRIITENITEESIYLFRKRVGATYMEHLVVAKEQLAMMVRS